MSLLFALGAGKFAYATPLSELHRSQAILAINDNRLDDAVELLDKAIKSDPGDSEAIYLRGSVYLRLNKPTLAQDDLRRVQHIGKGDKQLEKQLSLSWILLGREAYRQGQYQNALNNFNKAELASPGMAAVAELWQARAMVALGKRKQAIQLLTNALNKTQDNEVISELNHTLAILTEDGDGKTWEIKLRAGLANDSNIGLFPDGQTIPTGISNQADSRTQLDLGAQWIMGHASGSKTIFDYRLFKADYLTQTGFNLLSQTVSIDQRIRYKKGYWGINYQYVAADMDSFGQQNSNILSGYHTHSFNTRHTGLSKLSLNSRDFTYLGFQGYSGLSLEALYRMYVVGTNWNDKYFYGGLIRLSDTQNSQFSNTALGLEAGMDRAWKTYRYGTSAKLESRTYNGRNENNTELKLYGKKNFSHNINLELGLKALSNASSDALYNYTRNMLYLIAGWSR